MKMRAIGSRGRAGLSLVELMVLLAVMALVAIIFLPALTKGRDRNLHGPSGKCLTNLKNVGLAFRIFATDNNDQFPASVMMSNGVKLTSIDLLQVYRALSNELSTPRVLHCPADTNRTAANATVNFETMTLKNLSYFLSLSAEEHRPQVFLAGDRNLATNGVALGSGLVGLRSDSQLSWTKEIHDGNGNVVMGDGSVQQMSSSRLKAAVADQGIATNYLVLP